MEELTERDIQRLRAETKGTVQVAHFNNAGASLPPDTVVDTVVNYLREEALQGGYEIEAAGQARLAETYELIARLIHAERGEIAVLESASVAWSLAFQGMDLQRGDVVLTSEYEYTTNVIALIDAGRRRGVRTEIIPNDRDGNFSLPALEAAISPAVKLIAVTHIGSSTGGVLPVAAIGALARKHNIPFLVDACQSVGHLPVDVREMQCDMLSVTGRKYLRSPRGTGFLYVRQAMQDRLRSLFMDGFSTHSLTRESYRPRTDARRFELYESNRALTLGLGAAVRYALDLGPERTWQRIRELAQTLRQKLRLTPGVTVQDRGDLLCGIVTFSVEGLEPDFVKAALTAERINVSVGLARSTLYYMEKYGLRSVVRASVHYYNTADEIDRLVAVLRKVLTVQAREIVHGNR